MKRIDFEVEYDIAENEPRALAVEWPNHAEAAHFFFRIVRDKFVPRPVNNEFSVVQSDNRLRRAYYRLTPIGAELIMEEH